MLRLGLDIGGTKIEAQLLDGLGVSLLCKRIATPTTGYVDFLVAITLYLYSVNLNSLNTVSQQRTFSTSCMPQHSHSGVP